jgi:hypothetical protein
LTDLSSMGLVQIRDILGRLRVGCFRLMKDLFRWRFFRRLQATPKRLIRLQSLLMKILKYRFAAIRVIEEIASSLAVWGEVLAGLEGKILKAKADLAACVSEDDCLAIGESMDDLIKEKGSD